MINMKTFTEGLSRNWEYVHPLLKFIYWIEKTAKAILKEIKMTFDPWQIFLDSVSERR